MEAIRHITQLDDDILPLKLPESFKAQRVEVIVMLAAEKDISEKQKACRRHPSSILKDTRIVGDIISPVVPELLDTHIWIRWIVQETQLLPEAISTIINESDQVAVSAVSCWEVAYLEKRNRIILSLSIGDWLSEALEGSSIICLPLSSQSRLLARYTS